MLRVTGLMVQDMGSKLSDVHKRLARRSGASSNSSGSDSRPNSADVSNVFYDDTPQQHTRPNLVSGEEVTVTKFKCYVCMYVC